MEFIKIRGARVHNLKNVNLDLPLKKLICFAGPSGSGKSSLAFHTLLAESKRRFLNSYPNSIKFFIERPAAVDVDSIFPVLPVFGLPQINPIVGSRAVVSDVIRLTDSFQNLFFSMAREYCPKHDVQLEKTGLIQQIQKLVRPEFESEVFHLLVEKNDYLRIFGENFLPSRTYEAQLKKMRNFDPEDDHWEILRFKWQNLDQLELKLRDLKIDQYHFRFYLWTEKFKKEIQFSFNSSASCPQCDFLSIPVHTVSSFSPYSALGACSNCNGYGANLIYDDKKLIDPDLSIQDGGLKFLNYSPFEFALNELLKILKKRKISLDIPIRKLPKDFLILLNEGEGNYPGYTALKQYLDSKKYKPSVRIYIRKLQKEEPCTSCNSSRLNSNFSHYKVQLGNSRFSLPELMGHSIEEANQLFKVDFKLFNSHEKKLLTEIAEKLSLAQGMGLNHLNFLRKAKSLSAGEYQRLLLIKYLSFQGTDSLFILDEPSVGLDEEELKKVLKGLRSIINQGNTVILVDHSELIQSCSDYLVVMGPDSGKQGGQIVYKGLPENFLIESRKTKKSNQKLIFEVNDFVEVTHPAIFGKLFPDFKVPIHSITLVNGPSGSGKSSCLVKIMANVLHHRLFGDFFDEAEFSYKAVKCSKKFDDIIVVASELNRFTSRSTVGTLTELATVVRKHFLKLSVAKRMDLKDGHLSSNSNLGMCEKCEGKGFNVIEMQYLEDITIECEDCKGLKLKPIYANISDGEMTVAQAYNLPLNQVLERIDLTPKFRRVWEYLKMLNLDYLSLDRSLNSLSGGEKQRIYLLSKLLKSIENSLIILENISFGLSHRELDSLGHLISSLIPLKNTVIIIDSSAYFKSIASYQLNFKGPSIDLSLMK
jgi:excinuclease ABC subunit A